MQTKRRLLFIDGLRGIAALMVVIVHLFGDSMRECGLGVFVFFVLSGFVISYSLSNTVIDLRSSLSFIARRVVRLDPPYWAIFAASCYWQSPSLSSVASHAFYLQGLTGHPHVVGVAWTLCIEVQFYLSFLVFRFIAERTGRHIGFVTLPLLFASLLIASPSPSQFNFPALTFNSVTWIVPYYACFYLGIVTQQAFSAQTPANLFYLRFAIVASLLRLGVYFETWLLASVTTSVAIYLSAFGNRSSTWLSGPIFQFFGRISYSLYLWHVLVFGLVLYRVDSKLLAFVSAVGVSSLAYFVIERPSVRAAKRLFS